MQVASALNEQHPVDTPDISDYYLEASNRFPKSLVTDEELAAIVDPNVRDSTRRARDSANERRAEELMNLLIKVRTIYFLRYLFLTHRLQRVDQKFHNRARVSDSLLGKTREVVPIDDESNPLKKSKKSKAKAKQKAKSKAKARSATGDSESDGEVRTRRYSEKEAFGKMHRPECRAAVKARIKELEAKQESFVRLTVQNQVIAEMWDKADDGVKDKVRAELAKDHGLGPIFESFPKIAELSDDERVKAIEAVRQYQ